MFGKKKKYPWNHTGKEDKNSINGVYAGPGYYSNRSDPAEMNEVYAGPEYFGINSEPADFNMVYASPEVLEGKYQSDSKPSEDVQQKYCVNCGRRAKINHKFCGYCGAKLGD